MLATVIVTLFALRCAPQRPVVPSSPLELCTFLPNFVDEICSPSRNCEKRRKTDLEDIGHSEGVLGGLALGGDDGNGRP